MGMPMARSLVRAGLEVTVFDLRPPKLEEMRKLGATVAVSCQEMAANNNIILSIVNDIDDTEESLFGAQGIWQGIKAGGIIILSSTIGPVYCQKVYARGKLKNIQVLDAAVSKSGPTNIEGELTLMVGGEEDAFQRCQPVFKALANHVFHVGEIGAGQSYKLVNNLLSLGLAIVTREALNMGIKAGLDFNRMLEVMQFSTGNNWNLLYLQHLLKTRGTTAAADLPTKNIGNKDWNLALNFAREAGAQVPVSEFIHNLDAKTAYAAFDAVMQDKRL